MGISEIERLRFIFTNICTRCMHVEGEFMNMTRALDREKLGVHDRNRTNDLPRISGGSSIHCATRAQGEQGHLSTEFHGLFIFLCPTLVSC